MNTEQLSRLRHSLAHLLAQAVTTKYPHAKLTLGPAVDDGFYYDIDLGDTKIKEEDLELFTKMMRDKLVSWKDFTHEEVSAEKAKEILTNLARLDGRILKEPSPLVALTALGDNSVSMMLRCWVSVDNYWDVNYYLYKTVKETFDSSGISIPYPQRDIRLKISNDNLANDKIMALK